MSDDPVTDAVTDELARELRAAWFRYLDAIAPLRPGLHRYCLRLTRNVWDAEDLLQDALLRGFGALGRGDLHGEPSRVANPRAYLLRIASNLWIDRVRHAERDPLREAPGGPGPTVVPEAAREAGQVLFERATPQQRAAIVLKDVFDFTLEEIAELLSTSVGAVKTALHRGRARLKEGGTMARSARANACSRALVDRFVAAFNARDLAGVTATLLETVSIEVHGVGGGRGHEGVWAKSSLADGTRAEPREYHGEWLVLNLRDAAAEPELCGITRFEEVDGRVSRIQSYGYCPETLTHVADELGLATRAQRYHQPPEILKRMIASTALPWRSAVVVVA
jgi:RNA polymerase sigma-70 factor, ECF subfamily